MSGIGPRRARVIGRGVEAVAQVAELADDHVAARGQFADPQDDIPAFLHGIGLAIVERQIERDLGIARAQCGKAGDQRNTEADRQIDPHPPDRFVSPRGQRNLGLAESVERHAGRIEIDLTILGQPHRPRRALEQLRAEPRLKPLDRLADVRLAGRHLLGRARETGILRDRHKHGDVLDRGSGTGHASSPYETMMPGRSTLSPRRI
jgi:hypothetical protein